MFPCEDRHAAFLAFPLDCGPSKASVPGNFFLPLLDLLLVGDGEGAPQAPHDQGGLGLAGNTQAGSPRSPNSSTPQPYAVIR